MWTSGTAEEKRGEFRGVISSICVISRAFRGILGLWEHFQRFGVIPGDNSGHLKALLRTFGPFWRTKWDFWGVLWGILHNFGDLGNSLGEFEAFWGTIGDVCVVLGIFWVSGDIGDILGGGSEPLVGIFFRLLRRFKARMGILRSLGGILTHFKDILGKFRIILRLFGIFKAILSHYEGLFGATLRTFVTMGQNWGHLGNLVGIFGGLMTLLGTYSTFGVVSVLFWSRFWGIFGNVAGPPPPPNMAVARGLPGDVVKALSQ